MKTIEEIQKFLEQPIPRDEVATRSGGGNKSLSYLETWRVIDLLNEAFGNLGWDCETLENYKVADATKVERDGSVTLLPVYIAKVRIKAIVQVQPGQFINITKEGTGYGIDKSGLNAHEMASKEAESDALKRAAMKFGKRLGLALYDKTQEFVTDEKSEDKAPKVSTPARTTSHTVAAVRGESKDAVPAASPRPSRSVINEAISAHSQVALGKKLKTQAELLAMLSAYGAKSKDQLTDDQASDLLNKLKEIVKS